MAHCEQTPPAAASTAILIPAMARRYGLPEPEAARLIRRFQDRERRQHFADGWWVELIDAQFLTHVGPYRRIRCGNETHMAHLTPEPGELCHDCGCAWGEYHVFGCDSEECSRCGGQAFCCDCDDSADAAPEALQ